MKYLSVTEFAKKWNLTPRRVRMLCAEGRIKGAYLVGKTWNIKEDTKKPLDRRAKNVMPFGKFDVIDDLKKQVDKCRPLTEGERERNDEEFLIEFTHNSTAIEGNTLTLSETELVLKGVTINHKPLKDHMEIVGHRDAYFYMLDILKQKEELNEQIIKRIHSLVLINKPEDRGVYRKFPVRILGSAHEPPQPYVVAKLMEDLMHEMKEWRKTKHIAEQVALFHLQFESIHPFIDGNGRTGRLVSNLMLMQNGFPPIDIKFSDRKKYYSCFEDYHKTGSPKVMIKFVLKLLENELRKYLKNFD
jgi:Fic family protein